MPYGPDSTTCDAVKGDRKMAKEDWTWMIDHNGCDIVEYLSEYTGSIAHDVCKTVIESLELSFCFDVNEKSENQKLEIYISIPEEYGGLEFNPKDDFISLSDVVKRTSEDWSLEQMSAYLRRLADDIDKSLDGSV